MSAPWSRILCHPGLITGVSHTVHYLDKDNKSKFEVTADWGDVLNSTERVLLNLARAFIVNRAQIYCPAFTMYRGHLLQIRALA